MKEIIKKLTEIVKQLSKLMAEIIKLLTKITLTEMAIKTIIQIVYIPIWIDLKIKSI